MIRDGSFVSRSEGTRVLCNSLYPQGNMAPFAARTCEAHHGRATLNQKARPAGSEPIRLGSLTGAWIDTLDEPCRLSGN